MKHPHPHTLQKSRRSVSREVTVAALMGRFFVAGVFSILYTYAAELFPTPARSLMVGALSTMGRIGGMVPAPRLQVTRLRVKGAALQG